MCKNLRTIVMAGLAAVMLAGCGQVGDGDPYDTEPVFTSGTTYTKRTVHTTKTAMYTGGEIDDADMVEYNTTTTTITGSLENDRIFNPDDEVDEAMRATQRTEAKTYYTIPEHNGTTAAAVTVSAEATSTTAGGPIVLGEESELAPAAEASSAGKTSAVTTAFTADSLFRLEDSMKYSSDKGYTVTSDTTFLNLRFGPSKQYDIRLKIPDGASVTGLGETTGTDGNVWVYTSYNGTYGWVMRELLS
ncbi:SH3 domain-containing protein [Ruminococcus sp.]|uniref:SH3 domain-containing protein n=1 Tax=Ruminococcus sp. TaxID=41978 RepID=UPI0025EC94A4|nr:SH3 domain-containing protein [Ruminococcus sp.]MBQ8966176.1 SH3 domain-containing protein [Ruminococcus sp.]